MVVWDEVNVQRNEVVLGTIEQVREVSSKEIVIQEQRLALKNFFSLNHDAAEVVHN